MKLDKNDPYEDAHEAAELFSEACSNAIDTLNEAFNKYIEAYNARMDARPYKKVEDEKQTSSV